MRLGGLAHENGITKCLSGGMEGFGVFGVCNPQDAHTPDSIHFLDVTFYQETSYEILNL